MASLGVLAQLMQGMSASQLDMPRWNPVEEESQRELLQQRRTGTETGLLTLFEQKQKQAAEQEFLNAVKNDPRVAQMLLGTIGSLPTTGGGPPAPTSLTQQTIMPGQPPGAPQTVPGAGPEPARDAGRARAESARLCPRGRRAPAEYHRLAWASRPAPGTSTSTAESAPGDGAAGPQSRVYAPAADAGAGTASLQARRAAPGLDE